MDAVEEVRLRLRFGGEVDEWEKLSIDQLRLLLLDYEQKAGRKFSRKLSRIGHLFTFGIVGLLFWAAVIYLAWLPTEKAIDLLPEQPSLAIILGAVVFLGVLTFIIWGLLAEKAKLMTKLTLPLKRWESYIQEREDCHARAEAVRKLLQAKMEA